MILDFRNYLERKLHSKEEPENYLDAMKRELSINLNDIDFIDAPSVEFSDENLIFNQCILQSIKPIREEDPYVRVKLFSVKSPNLNQHIYRRDDQGKVIPYKGSIEGLKNKVFLMPKNNFAKLISRGWEASIKNQSGIVAF